MSTRIDDAVAVAEHFTAVACGLYERDGAIAPTISAAGRFGVVANPPPGTDLRLTVPLAIHWLAWGVRASHVALIAEGWKREYDADDPAGQELRHGDLERMAETDPEVQTTVVVTVFDVADPEAGAAIISTPGLGDDGGIVWDHSFYPGPPEGEMADAIRVALEVAPQWPPPKESSLHRWADDLVTQGVLASAYVGSSV